MKTVGEFKKAGVVFVVGDKGEGFEVRDSESFGTFFNDHEFTSFAWRDLTTKPDNPNFKIELDVDNHRWRPSLNQDVAPVNPPEFKVGDLVECVFRVSFKIPFFNLVVKIAYIDDLYIFGYVHSKNEGITDEGRIIELNKDVSIKPYNPKLEELKNIIGTHDDPTECAKAILAAGYNK